MVSNKKIVGPVFTVSVTIGISGLISDAILAAEAMIRHTENK